MVFVLSDTSRIDEHGTRYWHKDGHPDELHRDDDLPAVVYANGMQEWWTGGQLQRGENKPAIVHPDGTQEWWENGWPHREGDKPAKTYRDGTAEWLQRGVLHRAGGKPAVEYANGNQEWLENGALHRLDGPAIEFQTKEEFWVNGHKITGEELDLFKQAIGDTTSSDVLRELSRNPYLSVSAAAAHNPNCPIEDQVEWVLTHEVTGPML